MPLGGPEAEAPLRFQLSRALVFHFTSSQPRRQPEKTQATAAHAIMRAAVAWLMRQLEQRPFTTNAATGGVLGFLGDVICQKAVEGQAP